MAEFVKKGTLGYRKLDGGLSDPECSHVILKVNEFKKQLQRIREAEEEAKKAKRDADIAIRRVKTLAKDDVAKAKQEAAAEIDKIQKQLSEEKKNSNYWRGLNNNLLRISKERANADRKLKPKKTHTGYVVTYSTEKEYRYKERKNLVSVILWETVLQSPYSVDFTEEQAREQTKELFKKDKNGISPLSRIGIERNYGDAYERLIVDKEQDEWEDDNVLLETRYRANYKAGYWEVVFTHTQALGIVPTDMRP